MGYHLKFNSHSIAAGKKNNFDTQGWITQESKH